MTTPKMEESLWRDLTSELIQRLRWPFAAVVAVVVIGTLGYYFFGGQQWSLVDSLYMTSITLTTVGYGEIHHLGPTGRVFTTLLMWAGFAGMLYATAIVTAFFVEKDLGQLLRERLMQQRIDKLEEHYIVCGAGETGGYIVRELYTTQRPFVVVEHSSDRVLRLREGFEDILIIEGDAVDEGVLEKAGIERACGVFATLGDDAKNMLVTVIARFSNPDITIGTRCRDNGLANKFYRAGADYVVNTVSIGGMRMASEMIRPQVVSFLDRMLRDQGATRVEQVVLDAESPFAGKTLRDAAIHEHTGLLPIALERPDGTVVFNPDQDETLSAGLALIIIGTPEQVQTLWDYVNG